MQCLLWVYFCCCHQYANDIIAIWNAFSYTLLISFLCREAKPETLAIITIFCLVKKGWEAQDLDIHTKRERERMVIILLTLSVSSPLSLPVAE